MQEAKGGSTISGKNSWQLRSCHELLETLIAKLSHAPHTVVGNRDLTDQCCGVVEKSAGAWLSLFGS
jgi:hypothetical protein